MKLTLTHPRFTKADADALFAEEGRRWKEYNEGGLWSEDGITFSHYEAPPRLDPEKVRKALENSERPFSKREIAKHLTSNSLLWLGGLTLTVLALFFLFWFMATGTAIILLGLGAIGAWVAGLSH
jgi:hypothetical protein